MARYMTIITGADLRNDRALPGALDPRWRRT
jgi:hypothetical protein